jgi:hypothetical protein
MIHNTNYQTKGIQNPSIRPYGYITQDIVTD